ncbi:hypothetical protein F0344_08435 [Streptomyces finlayi]|uniref:Lipoprotein n=1 Tax=Streptomyces finlayi TaxID=67296 RepID=A0A7G7BH20_9ACTN|nr:hypothetical protein [Streptomyces finlayi]QNE74635.1 hypothetical protein F0344_08435 [Streptomyces finlayi]
MRRTGTTRRAALAATGAVSMGAVLAGCGDGPQALERSSNSGSRADARARARAADAGVQRTLRKSASLVSASLLAQYDQVAAAHPATAAGLAPLRSAVRAHTAALSKGAGRMAPARPATAPAVDPKAALKDLAAAARRSADAHTASLTEAEPELARLLASVAAAGAVHAYLLTELAKDTAS